jgi:hypothetical protein
LTAATSLQAERRRARTAPAARDFVQGGGWRAVSPGSGDRGGMTAHRGVLQPDEWVDRARLVAAVEARLGFTVDELRAVYRQGRKSAAQRELRAQVDARLLELHRSGANLSALGRVTGVNRKTFSRALARAGADLPA